MLKIKFLPIHLATATAAVIINIFIITRAKYKNTHFFK